MTIEHVSMLAVRKPWGSTDLAPWSEIADDGVRLVRKPFEVSEIVAVPTFIPGLDGVRPVDVRQNIARINASPFIPHKDSVRGFVYEVETGRLREVV